MTIEDGEADGKAEEDSDGGDEDGGDECGDGEMPPLLCVDTAFELIASSARNAAPSEAVSEIG